MEDQIARLRLGELDYHKTELAELWKAYRAKKNAFPHMPHYLSKMESRLIRLEEVRYGKESGSTRSGQIFRKLKSELEELGRAYLPEQGVPEEIVSIEQKPALVDRIRLNELSSYLFPPPQISVEGEEKDGSSPQVKAAAPATAELPEALQALDRERWLRLVWAYLNSDLAAQAPISEAKFKDCLNLINSAAGETGTQVEDTPVPWSELQYLVLLQDNVDWLAEEAPKFSTQKSAVLNAVRCRKKSESLIRGSGISKQYRPGFVRAWHLVRDEFMALELERRRAEDLLFANDIDGASKNLANLSGQYDVLIEKTQSLIQMQRQMQEAVHIIPHLRRFLVNEATHFETTSDLKSSIEGLNSTQRTAYLLADQLQAGVVDYGVALDSFERLSGDMRSIRDQFESDYFARLEDGNKSAADVVFHAMNLLASPIPEWYGGDYRETIRKNLDGWIAEQHKTFTDEVWEAKEASGPKATLSSADLQSILQAIPAPKTDGVLQDLNLGSLSSIRGSFSKLNPGGAYFDKHFNPKQEAVKDFASPIVWQAKLESLDFEIRNRCEIFSKLDSGLDVGRQLAIFDSVLLAHDRFERAKTDCWGAGDVNKMSSSQELPPFMLFGLIEHQETGRALNRLKSFETRDDNDRKAFQVEGLVSEFENDLTKLTDNWKKLSGSRLAWATGTQPSEFTDSLTFETKLKSELLPSDVEETDPLTMSMTLDLDRKTIRRASPFKYSETSPALTPLGIESNELKPRCDFEQVVGFRGHQIKEQFTMTREKVVAPEIVSFKTTHVRLPLGPPSVSVANKNGVEGDIVFILDCSKSMTKKVKGKDLETGAMVVEERFYFAKQALRAAIEELAKEKRFRFGLYAFGHRNGFKVDKNNILIETTEAPIKYEVLKKKYHPFEDCERLYSLATNAGPISTRADVQRILSLVNTECNQALGITPLYYSIKYAVETEYGAALNSKVKRYVVVLTDGENNQFGGPNPNKSVPRDRTPQDQTTTNDSRQALEERGATLFVARISKQGKFPNQERLDLQAAGALNQNILSVNESESQSIADSLLNAIGRSQFSVTRKGQQQGLMHKIPETVKEKQSGDYVVQTSGVAKPDAFDVELHNGVSVALKNTPLGLVLDDGSKPKFAISPAPIDANLAAGVYQIGRVSASVDNQLAFGFEKLTKLAGSNFRNFSFRPQRVWAQVSDSKTGKKLFNLFLPQYQAGQYPIAVFTLPQTDKNLEVDVRLWIAPSINDRGPLVAPYSNTIALGESVNKEIDCKLERDVTENTSTIATKRSAEDYRDFFVGCPDASRCVRLTEIKDGVLDEKYEYTVKEANANFTLSVLPRNEYSSIMERVNNSSQRYGTDQDPIFGDQDSVWIDFKGIKINN